MPHRFGLMMCESDPVYIGLCAFINCKTVLTNYLVCCYVYRRWYREGRIPYEFRPRHAILTMHVWFLHKRLLADRVDPHAALLVQVGDVLSL